jgi:hypothetical protein
MTGAQVSQVCTDCTEYVHTLAGIHRENVVLERCGIIREIKYMSNMYKFMGAKYSVRKKIYPVNGVKCEKCEYKMKKISDLAEIYPMNSEPMEIPEGGGGEGVRGEKERGRSKCALKSHPLYMSLCLRSISTWQKVKLYTVKKSISKHHLVVKSARRNAKIMQILYSESDIKIMCCQMVLKRYTVKKAISKHQLAVKVTRRYVKFMCNPISSEIVHRKKSDRNLHSGRQL